MARHFVATLRATYPSAELTLVAHRRVADLWQGWPDSDVVVYDPSRGRFGAMIKTATRLRERGPYDAGYLLTPSLSSVLLFAWAGIATRIGFAGDTRGWLLSDPVAPMFGHSAVHLSMQYLTLLGGAAMHTEGATAPQWLPVDAPSIDDRLRDAGLHGKRFVVAAVGTEGESKRYPVEAWVEALRMVSESATVICVGTAGERALTRQIVAVVGKGVLDWSGSTNLVELATLLKRAAAFAGADSGAAHLAAMVGTPTVVIFGPGNPQEVRPLGAEVTVLREPLWCSPCGRARCPRRDYPRECLDLIAPAAVGQAILAQLGSV